MGRQQLRQSTWVLSELWVAFNCVGTFPPPTRHLDFIALITPNCLVQQQMWICQTKNAIKGEAAQGALYEDGVGTHLATCFKTLLALLPSFFLSLAVTNCCNHMWTNKNGCWSLDCCFCWSISSFVQEELEFSLANCWMKCAVIPQECIVYTLVCTAAGICTVATVQPAGEEWEG